MSDRTLQIVCASALDVPADFAADFHALITDPPYSRHVHKSAVSLGGGQNATEAVKARDLGFAPLSVKLRHWIARASARVQGWSLIYSDVESAHLWRISIEAAATEYIRTVPYAWEACDVEPNPEDADELARIKGVGHVGSIPWVRWSQPQLSGDRPPTGSEMVTIGWGRKKARKFWNGPGGLVKFDRTKLPANKTHPTEKPLDLLLDQVSWFSQPGEAVIDPCAGVGTTGLACRLLGRDFFGIELSGEWAEFGAARLLAPLSTRDRERAEAWCVSTIEAAEGVLAAPRQKDRKTGKYTDERTRERAGRRIADCYTVAAALEAA